MKPEKIEKSFEEWLDTPISETSSVGYTKRQIFSSGEKLRAKEAYLQCRKDLEAEIRADSPFSFLDDEEENIYTESDGIPIKEDRDELNLHGLWLSI